VDNLLFVVGKSSIWVSVGAIGVAIGRGSIAIAIGWVGSKSGVDDLSGGSGHNSDQNEESELSQRERQVRKYII